MRARVKNCQHAEVAERLHLARKFHANGSQYVRNAELAEHAGGSRKEVKKRARKEGKKGWANRALSTLTRGRYQAEEMLVNWGGEKWERNSLELIKQTEEFDLVLEFSHCFDWFWFATQCKMYEYMNVEEEKGEKESKVELLQLWTCCNCSCCATNCTSYQVTQSKACEIIWNSSGIKYFGRKVLCGTSFGAQLQAGSMSKDSRLRECVAPRYPVALWRQLGLFKSSNLLALRYRVSW